MLPTDLSSQPSVLRHEVRHAARLSFCFARFLERHDLDETSRTWATARAEQLRGEVAAAVREHQRGRLDDRRAANRIGSYVQDLQESLVAYTRSLRVRALSASAPHGA